MNLSKTVQLIEQLINIQSVSPSYQEICNFLCKYFQSLDLDFELIPTKNKFDNLLVKFGKPKIIFTTHLDVVDGLDSQFCTKIEKQIIYGRGACDAKGIAACMLAACLQLREQKESNFALLLVFDEETTGLGAKTSAEYLKTSGVEYIINGEPSEGKIIKACKGCLDVRLTTKGKSCHSGYPEQGEDANKKLIKLLNQIYLADFGNTKKFGSSSVCSGKLMSNNPANSLSAHASAEVSIRTTKNNEEIISQLREIVKNKAELEIIYNVSPVKLLEVSDFETGVASYASDIPNFLSLTSKIIMYGPGSILRAHSDNEFISFDEIETAFKDYQKIFKTIKQGV